MWRAIALALLAYLSLDFADPSLPGALNFELEKSVDAVSSQPRAKLPPAIISVPPVPPPIAEAALFSPAMSARPVIAVARTLPLHLRPRAVLSARPPVAADDH